MDLGKSFVAHSKTMEIMEPGMSTFDYPSIFSGATAMLEAALRKNGFDTPITQFLPVCFGVVSAISIDDLRLFQRASTNTTDGWNRVNKRQQLCDVMAIGTGQDDREWHPISMIGLSIPLTLLSRRPRLIMPMKLTAPFTSF
jgi:hypothetical protein